MAFAFWKKNKNTQTEDNNTDVIINHENEALNETEVILSDEIHENSNSEGIPSIEEPVEPQTENMEEKKQPLSESQGEDEQDSAPETSESEETEKIKENREVSLDKEESEDAAAEEATEETGETGETGETEEKDKNTDGFFARLKKGLSKTRDNIVSGLDLVFKGAGSIDDDLYEELEEQLILGDLGVRGTDAILERLKVLVKERRIRDPEQCREALIESIRDQMDVTAQDYEYENNPTVIMVIGVNGVGKTTSVGKLAAMYKGMGKKVLIAAADTFRAGATEQLTQWAVRAGVDIIRGQEGQDPASVVFDAAAAARGRHADILICDTAGRLHNKKNLMEELKKMSRILEKELPDYHRESFIVLDGTTGQNALQQARDFSSVTALTGIVITKLDGTAKGGIAIAIQSELGVPVKFIGVGEQLDDLQKFDPDSFVKALFS